MPFLKESMVRNTAAAVVAVFLWYITALFALLLSLRHNFHVNNLMMRGNLCIESKKWSSMERYCMELLALIIVTYLNLMWRNLHTAAIIHIHTLYKHICIYIYASNLWPTLSGLCNLYLEMHIGHIQRQLLIYCQTS